MDLFLFFSDLLVETEVGGNGAVAVGGSGAEAVVESSAAVVVDMVADVVVGNGTAFSDAYAVASVVVFTIYRSPTLVPEMKIPPGDDVVNAPRPNVERAPARSS